MQNEKSPGDIRRETDSGSINWLFLCEKTRMTSRVFFFDPALFCLIAHSRLQSIENLL